MKLGILGSGQLARMLALSCHQLGITPVGLAPNVDICAAQVSKMINANFDDEKALLAFAKSVDVVTIETENIPLACLDIITKVNNIAICPNKKALEIAQDRFLEKQFFNSLKIPTTTFAKVNSEEELRAAIDELGLLSILKTRRFGYDGKGQLIIKDAEKINFSNLPFKNEDLILEKFVNFKYEVSIIAARNHIGEVVFYPLTLNTHKDGILRYSEVPFKEEKLLQLQEQAECIARKILEALDYIGVIAIEYFFDGEQLIANEFAPRVHNSGHWTIEGAKTSQFENHLRAVFNLPLGSTEIMGHCLLVNSIGKLLPLEECLKINGLHYHSYGKDARPGRKIGHVTIVAPNLRQFEKNKEKLLAMLTIS